MPIEGSRLHAFVNRLSVIDAADGGSGANRCPTPGDQGGNGGAGGNLLVLLELAPIHVGSPAESKILNSFNAGPGENGNPPGTSGNAGTGTLTPPVKLDNSFQPSTGGTACPAATGTGLKEVGFNVLPSPPGVPQYAAAGPTSADALIGLLNTNQVLAVNGSTGKLDTSIGSGGVLPLPGGLPGAATVAGVTFGGGSIYATFYDSSNQGIYVGDWNAAGQLNGSFGTSGLATIASDSTHYWTSAFLPLVVGGNIVIGAGNLDAEGVTLIPINPTNGTVGTPVATPAPSGISSILQNAMAVGPDGNLYIVGSGFTVSGYEVYDGIFNPSTLGVIGQSAFADGDSATGEAVAFGPSTTYVGVSSTTGMVTGSDLFSGPLGSASGLTKTPIPLAVAGDDQATFGLQYSSSTGLIAGVYDQSSSITTTWLEPFNGSAFSTPVQIGANGAQGYALVPYGSGGAAVGTQLTGNTLYPFVAPTAFY